MMYYFPQTYICTIPSIAFKNSWQHSFNDDKYSQTFVPISTSVVRLQCNGTASSSTYFCLRVCSFLYLQYPFEIQYSAARILYKWCTLTTAHILDACVLFSPQLFLIFSTFRLKFVSNAMQMDFNVRFINTYITYTKIYNCSTTSMSEHRERNQNSSTQKLHKNIIINGSYNLRNLLCITTFEWNDEF